MEICKSYLLNLIVIIKKPGFPFGFPGVLLCSYVRRCGSEAVRMFSDITEIRAVVIFRLTSVGVCTTAQVARTPELTAGGNVPCVSCCKLAL